MASTSSKVEGSWLATLLKRTQENSDIFWKALLQNVSNRMLVNYSHESASPLYNITN